MAVDQAFACVSCHKENSGSERANYGFIGRNLISGNVPHILSAYCRQRIGANFNGSDPVIGRDGLSKAIRHYAPL